MKRHRIEEAATQTAIKVAADDDPRYLEERLIHLKGQPTPQTPVLNAIEADDETDQSDDADSELCPFCGEDTCPHHAASLDLTFGEVVGGELYDAIDACLERITTALTNSDEDANLEADRFERLLEILEALPSLEGIDSVVHGGPGHSLVMRHYWVEDVAEMADLARRLGAIDD